MTDLDALNALKKLANQLGFSNSSDIVKVIDTNIQFVQNGGTL